MKNQSSRFMLSLCFIYASIIAFNFSVEAQVKETEPEIKQYVVEKGKKAQAPADIANVARGDLNGDGKEDVVVQYYIQIGYPGNLTNTYLAVFLNKNGKMNFAVEADDVKVIPAKIEKGILICDKYGEDSKKFEKVGTVKFKLVKKKLVEVKTTK